MPGQKMTARLALGLCLLLSGPLYADDEAGLQTYLSANGLLQRGLYDLAAEEYEAFLKEHPQHAKADRARYGLGVCRFRAQDYPGTLQALAPLEGKDAFTFAAEVAALQAQASLAGGATDEAVAACGRFLKRHGRHKLAENVTAILAEACLQAGRYKDVREVGRRFGQRWSRSPLRERVWFFVGSAELALEQWEDAAQAFDQLLDGFPKSAYRPQALLFCGHSAERLGYDKQARQRYEQLLGEPRCGEQGDALLALAGLARDRADKQAALQRIGRLLKDFPEHPRRDEARLLRASVLLEQDQVDEARRDLARIEAEELADRVAYWQAKTTLRAGDADAAARMFAEATKRYPDSALQVEMQYDRCVALLAGADQQAARAALDAFCKTHRSHPLASEALLSLIHVTQAAGDLEAAERLNAAFQEQHGDHPDAALAALLQADNAYQREAFEDALRGYRSFLKRFNKSPLRSEAQLRMGLTLYRLEQYDKAKPILQRVVRDEPLPAAVLALAEILYAEQAWADAAQLFATYSTQEADAALRSAALLKRGLAMQRQGAHAEAIESFDQVMQLAPDSDAARQARFERGQALTALGRGDEAQRAFQATLDAPELAGFARRHLAQLASQRGDQREVLRIAGELLASPDARLRAEANLMAGQAQLLLGDPVAAEEHLRAFLQDESDDFTPGQRGAAQLQLAQALSRQEKLEEARTILQRWQRSGARHTDAATQAAGLYELAWTQRRLGEQDEAKATFTRLLKQQPPAGLQARTLVELAELHAGNKDCAAAVSLLEQVERLDADADVQAAAAYRLGVCAFEREDFEQASRRLGRFVERFAEHPLQPSVRYFCAESLVRLGKHQAALPHLRKVVADFKKHEVYGPCLVRLGDCLVARQQWAAAGEAYATYRDRFADGPLWHEAQFGSGWSAENQGRYDDAIKAYRVIVGKHKGETAARAQFQIGECLFAQKDYEQAVRELLRVEILYAYPEWSAAALYEAGRCFEAMDRNVEARKQFQACCDRYESTRWAELSRGRLAVVAEELLPGRSGS